MAVALEGRGNPPVDKFEILALAADDDIVHELAAVDVEVLSKLVVSLGPMITDRNIPLAAAREFSCALLGAAKQISHSPSPSDVEIGQAAVREPSAR